MGVYDDIIGLEYTGSKRPKKMSAHDRAAQFSPFAALTGYEEIMDETARTTDEKLTLSENHIAVLDGVFSEIAGKISEKPLVEVTYYVPDLKKPGGKYYKTVRRVCKISAELQSIEFDDGSELAMDDIYEIKFTEEKP